MSPSLTRDEVIAALIRHPEWSLEPAHSRDIWSLISGEEPSGDTKDGIERRLEELNRAMAIEMEYRDQGIWIMTCVDESYPRRLRERLGSRAPALLYGFGESGLLDLDGVGVVGSRDVGEAGEQVVVEVAKAVAGANRVLVSGGARGVDQISMREALAHGGSAVGVLTHPLTGAAVQSDNQSLAEEGRLCFVTPFQPDLGFTVANAMARNKIIYALTDCTLVVAADLKKGGSWTGATEAIRHGFTRVAVWAGDGGGNGNGALIEKGGIPVSDVSLVLDQERLNQERELTERQLRLNLD